MGKERVIEGLNQDAQLRLKSVLDGLDNFRRGVAQVQDDLGSDMPKAIGETEQALLDLDKDCCRTKISPHTTPKAITARQSMIRT